MVRIRATVKGLIRASVTLPVRVIAGGECLPSNVINSNNSYTATVTSGATLTLPNEELKIFVNGTLNQTATYIPLSGQNINIS
jgi:hypothetical protein